MSYKHFTNIAVTRVCQSVSCSTLQMLHSFSPPNCAYEVLYFIYHSSGNIVIHTNDP